jgi:predicted nucleotidyltransferase
MTIKVATRFPIPYEKIETFCRKWNIIRFEFFGSILRADFDSNRSDVDVLVTFAPGATPGLEYFSAEEELARILGRPVEMTTRRTVEQSDNWIRREAILAEAQTVYES